MASTPADLLAAPNLSDRAKVVRVVLGLHADHDGLYRGTKDWARLAKLLGFSSKKVQRALLDLEVFGSVVRVSRGRRPSDVRLLDRTPPVQASADRSPVNSVRSDISVPDTSVRSDTAAPDIGVRSDRSGPVKMGGLGGVRTDQIVDPPGAPSMPDQDWGLTTAGVEQALIELDQARRRIVSNHEGPTKALLHAARISLGRDAERHARNLGELIREMTLPRVIEVMEYRWEQVALGKLQPHHAAASFHGDGGGFRGSIGAQASEQAAQAIRERGRHRTDAKARKQREEIDRIEKARAEYEPTFEVPERFMTPGARRLIAKKRGLDS